MALTAEEILAISSHMQKRAAIHPNFVRLAKHTAIGGLTGAAINGGSAALNNASGLHPKQSVLTNALGGAVMGGLTGAYVSARTMPHHSSYGTHSSEYERRTEQARERARAQNRAAGAAPGEAAAPKVSRQPIPDWLKNVKTKAEAKKKFHEQVGKHHPDKGGSADKMRAANTEWDAFKAHYFDKLAHISIGAFLDEYFSICGLT
jgi:hypothetical protein